MMAELTLVHDKVRIAAGNPRQWLVYDSSGTLRAAATSEQSAKDFIAIQNQKNQESPMTGARLTAGLARLGYNLSTGHRLLGIGRSTLYRMANRTSEVPEVVRRLLDMYERYSIPEEHQ